MPPMRLPQTLLNGKNSQSQCLPGLAVRSSCHWDVMECGTLNTNEALCGDIDLLPFHSGMRVPAARCMCHGRSSLFNGEWGGLGQVMLHTLVGVVVVLHTDSPACNLVGETVGIFHFIVQKNLHKYTVISNELI